VQVVQADVHDDAQLARLVAGSAAVINLIAILHGSASAFHQVHAQLPARIAQACAATGVRRVIHVSALGVGPDAPSNYLRSKTEGEAALCTPAVDATLLRPSVVFGASDRFMNVFAALQALAPVVPLACSTARFQPVWVEDVASAIVRCLDDARTIGQTYACVGPTVYTLSELVRLAGRWSGHERPQIPLPEFAGQLQAFAMECLPGQPLMSRDNIASMRVANVASADAPGLAALGLAPTALEAVAPAYLGAQQGCARLDRYRAQARRG
jgi:NADH dehydrogenase